MPLPGLSALPTLADCQLLQLPQIGDPRGNLTYLEGKQQCPFEIRRVFYLYGVPEDGRRAGHALRTCQQVIVAISGAFDLVLHDGSSSSRVRLDSPTQAFHLPPMIWREVDRFSAGAVCLVLASEEYAEAGYVRSFAGYQALREEPE